MVLSDDITEMYSELRALVQQYLGISPTPKKRSSDVELASYSMDECLVGLPSSYTEPRGQSAPLPTRRLWSHPSITDSSEVTRSNVCGNMLTKSPPPARGSVVSDLTQVTSRV